MKNSGNIIVLAFPDTFVTHSNELICKFLPLVGLGTREYIKAGHAALILVENETGKLSYFDFGRYVTPNGFGRVRCAITDTQLAIPFLAQFDADGAIDNLKDILRWLDAHPEKTRGEGRLLASVCQSIDYAKALDYILKLQSRGSIPYGAFDKNGSNCARFVTDTILSATADKRIIKALKFNKKFTPSTVGNVEKAALSNAVYQVIDGEIGLFNGSAFKENLKNYFSRKKKDTKIKESPAVDYMPSTAQKLSGIGSSAWFDLRLDSLLPANHFRIQRFNELGKLDFDGVYYSEEFKPDTPFTFSYDSHCAFCHVVQNATKIKLTQVGRFAEFNLAQKMHSA